MGCAQSKIENEESVSRCKDRRNFMKEAVAARNAFASGHSGYALALKNTGAALSDYAQGETEEVYHPHLGGGGGESSEPLPPPPPIMEHPLPPPPPPLPTFSPVPPPMPSFSPTPTTPLQRSVTMPAISVTKKGGRKMKNTAIVEEEEEEEDDDDEEEEEEDRENDLRGRKGRKSGSRLAAVEETPSPLPRTPVAPPPPESKGMAWDYFFMVDNMPEANLSEEDDDVIYEKDDEEEEEQMEGEHHHLHHDNHHHQVEPKTPEKVVMEGFTTEEEETPVMATMKDKQFVHSNTAPPDLNRRGGGGNSGGGGGGMVVGSSSVNLMKILGEIDDHFLKASESAQELSHMLEATRLHFHSTYADNQGNKPFFCFWAIK